MRGVQFGDYHTVDDWNLILNAKKIDTPEPKVIKVKVDGRDGDLNLSRALTGTMKFENREASFTFIVTEGTQAEREALISEITNIIHGNELQIIEPDDPDHYLLGECSVTDVFNDRAYGAFTIEADCDPYRYAIQEVNRILSLTDTEVEILLNNTGRKTVTPTLIVSDNVNLSFETSEVALGRGTYKLTNLALPPGITEVTVTGSGTLTISYREAVL